MSASYTYVGTDERYYPELGIEAVPGESHTLARKPDDNWVALTSKKAAEKTDAPTDAAPAPVADSTNSKA